ncbi:phage tail protein [Dyella marensis]|uniref:phage tail protein n=1 Tax=Dyella marensis TaxID=500610 RepID=UPI0031CEDE0A
MEGTVLMAFGPFVFGMRTAAYEELQRQMQFKHAASARVGKRDAFQIVGPGSELLTLSGTVAPEVSGTLASITQLETMGKEGRAYVLVDGAGHVYGVYFIDSLQTTQSAIHADGTPRKVAFSLTLCRSDDEPADEAPGDHLAGGPSQAEQRRAGATA